MFLLPGLELVRRYEFPVLRHRGEETGDGPLLGTSQCGRDILLPGPMVVRLKCGSIYSEYHIVTFFIEGLQDRIRVNVRNQLFNRPEWDISKLSRYATSVSALHKDRTAPTSIT